MLIVYLKIITKSQSFLPRAYIQDISGKKHLININESFADDIYRRAIKLKNHINTNIENETANELAIANQVNCSICDYKPFCETHKKNLINNFDSQNIDVYGIIDNIQNEKATSDFEIIIESAKYKVMNNMINTNVKKGDIIYIYNLFSTGIKSRILYTTKRTIIIAV